MSDAIEFFVPGVPVPKGSAKAFFNRGTGRAHVTQSNLAKQKPWSSLISLAAKEQMGDRPLWDGPVGLQLAFTMPRPKNHLNSKGAVKPSAPYWHTSKPDLDKLVRCVKDALTSIAWTDDSKVATMGPVFKAYGDVPGVRVRIYDL